MFSSGGNNNQSDDMDVQGDDDGDADYAGAGSNPRHHHHEVVSPPTNHGDQPPPPMDTPFSAAGRSLMARVNSQGAAYGTPNARIEQAVVARTSGSRRVTFEEDEEENALNEAQDRATVHIRTFKQPALAERQLASAARGTSDPNLPGDVVHAGTMLSDSINESTSNKARLTKELEKEKEKAARLEGYYSANESLRFCLGLVPGGSAVSNYSTNHYVQKLINDGVSIKFNPRNPGGTLRELAEHARNVLNIGDANQVMDMTPGQKQKTTLQEIICQIRHFATHPEFRGFIEGLMKEFRDFEGKRIPILPQGFPTHRIACNSRKSFKYHRLMVVLYLQCPGFEDTLVNDHCNEKERNVTAPF